jgi:hypothetical protein
VRVKGGRRTDAFSVIAHSSHAILARSCLSGCSNGGASEEKNGEDMGNVISLFSPK